ncbi:MAG: GntR family transcriptional regulator [Pseudomonadota bacterium]
MSTLIRDEPPLAELPKFQQLARMITREIAAGRLADGERLPPERQFARQLGTSIGTLRKALGILASEGRIERVQGSGNYVRFSAERDAVYSLFRLERVDGRGPGQPRARILDVNWVRKTDELKPFGSALYGTRIRRLRWLDEVQIAVEEIWLDGAAGKLDAARLTDALYQDYFSQLGLQITRATDAVSVAQLPGWTPVRFDAACAGYIERTAWSAGGDSVEFSRTWFDPDQAVYVQRLR